MKYECSNGLCKVITGAQKCGRGLDQSPGILTITADLTQAGEERLSILLEVREVADNWVSPRPPDDVALYSPAKMSTYGQQPVFLLSYPLVT